MDKKTKRTALGLIIVIALTALIGMKAGSWLPVIGAQDSPANSYLSPYYILSAKKDTHANNIVTAVLADYRGFDTLFETCVLFLSGIATLMVLSTKERVIPREKKHEPWYSKSQNREHHASYGGTILQASFRLIVPVVMIYGVYVLFHGELSLGGGFQAGALVACAYLLDRIMPSFVTRIGEVREEKMLIVAGLGVFVYAFTGILPMFFGGNFLEYSKLPFAAFVAHGEAGLHTTGILMIEIGVSICVAAVIMTILEVVLERTDFEDE
ncbi:MAG: hypothetical protein IKT31_11095 [Firmicutes bacterium]|nr:hypothetical protein [Bacillota bacterium]